MATDEKAVSHGEGKKLSGTFTVEMGNDFSQRISIHTLRKVVRGRFSLAAQAKRKDKITGKRLGMRSVGDAAGQIPDTGGIHYKFELGSNTVTEFDPLTADTELHEAADKAFGKAIGSSSHKTKPWPTIKMANMDRHVFKTFCREIRRLVDCDDARVVSGAMPNQDEIDGLPGKYLFDPFNSSPMKPRFEDDYPSWLKGIESQSAG